MVGFLASARKKIVGKPYEGEPHVRFEVAGVGNGLSMKYRANSRPYQVMRPTAVEFVGMYGTSTQQSRQLFLLARLLPGGWVE